MKNLYNRLTIAIVIIFVTGIAMSIVPELFPKFFGDSFCQGKTIVFEKQSNNSGRVWSEPISYTGCDQGAPQVAHNPEWHWGYQHWMWFAMGIALFIVQIFRIVNITENHGKKTS